MQAEMIRGSPDWSRRQWMTNAMKAILVGTTAVMASSLAGCESNDDRLVKMATDNARRQADQSQDMARLQQQVAEGTKELVASEAAARREWAEAKHDLQTDRVEVGKQRDALEAERRTMAASRYREPILAAAIETLGLVIASLIPLIAAIYALRQTSSDAIDPAVAAILLGELTGRPPRHLRDAIAKPLAAPDDELPF